MPDPKPYRSTWTVLAPGPSLRRLKAEDIYANGPIVCVNNAALAPLPRDFWCCLDPIKKFEQIWKPLEIHERKALGLVWCRERQAPAWQEHHLRVWAFAETETEFREQNLKGIRTPTVSMMNLTILTAISRCIGLGAARVELFGVDMAGEQHSHGADPDGRTRSAWPVRWKQEEKVFDLAMKEWRSLGVDVVRREPPT